MRKPGKRSRERDGYLCSNHKDEQDKYFFKVLAGNFRERLAIPDKFAQHFRGLKANSVKLESRCGHTFDVEVAKNLGKVVLQTGWKEFVTTHELNMGDFLVFKYDGTSRLKLFIFDHSCCEKVSPCLVKRNHICGRERTEMHNEISSSCGDHPMNVTASSSPSPSDSSEDSISPEDQKSHSVPGYILPRGTYLTRVQMKNVKERVRARTSRIPIYGCIMKKSNLRKGGSQGVDILRAYADVYLPFEDQKLMLQCRGKSWEVRCVFRKSTHRTKRLSEGWTQFARDNKLQLGDLCLFELLENTKYTMNVHVIRANHIHGRERREEHIGISSSSEDLAIKSHVNKRKAWNQRMGRGMASSEDEEAHPVPSYMLPRRASLDSIQKKKVKERLRAICSEIPIYVCIVKKTNIYTNSENSPAMEFSTKYSEVYLPFKSRRLILQCHGMSWEVMCHIQVRKNQRPFKKIFRGWPQFARDNNLQLGDICLFEPLKTKKYMMNVHIIRKE